MFLATEALNYTYM